MAKSKIMNSVTRTFSRAGLQLKKHSPEILVVAGVAGTVVSAVMACKATTKVNFILEEAKEKVETIHDGVEKGEVKGYLENGEVGLVPYSEEDGKKDLAIVYVQTGVKLAKLYAPSVILGALSITSILASNNILRKRNIGLMAAYATLDTSFKEYRGRVIERFGKELDRELKYNIKAKEVEEIVVNEDGTESTVKKTIEVAEANSLSPYAICFDETCAGWDRDAEINKFFLLRQQDYANELLRSRGHLFLNEVYDMLGAQRTKAGQIVGWVYDEKNPIGDNYVDFGIFNIHVQANRAFVNGYEKSIWIDPNVDGPVYDLLK